MDFAGPEHGKVYFILIDANSKWVKACNATSQSVIEEFRTIFLNSDSQNSRDSGTCFVSLELRHSFRMRSNNPGQQ